MCIACRRRAPKRDFVRLVRTEGGEIVRDPGGGAPGRGAYVCSDVGCFDQAARRGRFARALRGAVGAAEIERLRREFVA